MICIACVLVIRHFQLVNTSLLLYLISQQYLNRLALYTLAAMRGGRHEATSMEIKHVEKTAHILRCSLLSHPCTLDALLQLNEIGYECTEQWKRKVRRHDDDDDE